MYGLIGPDDHSIPTNFSLSPPQLPRNMALNYGMRSFIKRVKVVSFQPRHRHASSQPVIPRIGVRVFGTGRCTAFAIPVHQKL